MVMLLIKEGTRSKRSQASTANFASFRFRRPNLR
jgi:hypothetical protein